MRNYSAILSLRLLVTHILQKWKYERGLFLFLPVKVGLVMTIMSLIWMTIFALDVQAASFDLTGNCPGGIGDVGMLTNTITAANNNGEADTIILAPNCVYTLNAVNNTTGGHSNGLPAITSQINIIGNGATITRDSSALDFRIFYVSNTGDLRLENLVISNGRLAVSFGEGFGSAIYNEGRLSLDDGAIINNEGVCGATCGEGGGGIYNGNAGVLTVTNSLIANNYTVNWGGGILNKGIAIVDNSMLSNNKASLNGGAIFNVNGTFTLNNSTINNNLATNDAGLRNTGKMTIHNSTISGNSGLYAIEAYGFITIINSTITNNSFRGVRVFGTVNLANSIIANHPSTDCEIVGGMLQSLDYNLASDNSCNLIGPNDQPNTNPLLGPLSDNGGGTLTHALLPGSPAIDKGNPATPGSGGNSCLASDQRGIIRPVDGDNDLTAICDIGAYEVAPVDLQITKNVTPTLVSPGGSITYTLTFTNAGPGIATNVVITDFVPITITNLSVFANGAIITDSGLSPGFVWNVQDLAPNQGGVITISGQVKQALTAGARITNTAAITTSAIDSDAANNIDLVGLDIFLPNLAINKTVTPETNVTYHGQVTYTITLRNLGLAEAANTLLTDTLPLSATFAGWIEQPAGAKLTNDQITWNGVVPSGQAITFTFVAGHTGDYGDAVTNTAEFSHTSGNGSDDATFVVESFIPPLPVFTINDIEVTEGNSGTSVANFEVTLSTVSPTTVTVNYATIDGTATVAGNDYLAATGALTFAPGITTQTVAISVNGDLIVEPDENFFVNLSGATGATIADDQGQGIILNDDNAAISISDATMTEGDANTTTATFNLILSTPSDTTVTVNYATADGAATIADNDYLAASGTVIFPPNNTAQTIPVTINGDTAVESDEIFYVNLSNASGATIAGGQGIGTITNDDTASAPPPAPSEPEDNDDDDDDDEDAPPALSVPPASADTPLPVSALPETGLRPPATIWLWFGIVVVGLGMLAVWGVHRRRRS